jgi:hypothetical protein
MNSEQPDRKRLAEQLQEDWEALRSVGDLFTGTALGYSAEQLRPGSGWPEDLQDTPIILAIDGPSTALTVAARTARDLALVLTDEPDLVREVLNEAGRPEVPVSADPEAIVDLVMSTERPKRWIGLGSADYLTQVVDSDLVGRLRVTQLQVPSGAAPILAAAAAGRLALDLVSANPADGESGPAVAIAAALLLPSVDFHQVNVGVDESGRFQLQHDGFQLWWGITKEPGALQTWVDQALS